MQEANETMKTEQTYDKAILRLEQIAKSMEDGDVTIDRLTADLKEAQQLLAFCRDKLTKAEAEVQKLLQPE